MRYLTLLLATLIIAAPLAAQDKTDANPRAKLHDYLLACCQEHFAARKKSVAALKTADDVRERQESLKKSFLASIGPMPEKTPLNAEVVGVLKGDGFRVEKVIYESRPNHHVTANLYLPDGKGPFPGVLVPCGHSTNGKAYDGYQRVCILLAKNGMAALCFDPIGQGERLQLLKDDTKPGISGTTNEHTAVGVGGWLVGQGTASYRIWDGIRSLDYLASRPEIDAKKLGCCGNSGGGTMTAYLMALDDRIACAAPSCYITSLEKLFATIGPQDAEQNIVGQVKFGMEHADFLALRAPKPTLMAVATQDFFNIDGAWATYREASLLYSKLGHAERVAIMEYDDKHGFSKPRREATVRWMRRWLLGVDDAIVEEKAAVFKDEELQCTRSGQVLADKKGLSAFGMNVKYAEAAKGSRDKFLAMPPEEQVKAIKSWTDGDMAVVTGSRERGGTAIELDMHHGVPLSGNRTFAKNGVAGLRVLVCPENRPTGRTTPIAETHIVKGQAVLEIDLRGLGGLPANAKPAFFSHDFVNTMLGLHLGRPLAGQRIEDVLAATRWWMKESKDKILVVGEGLTAIPVLHAAALDSDLAEVVIERGVVSWDNVVRTPTAVNQLGNVLPGVLQKYDLPQLAAKIAPRPLTLRGTVDAMGKVLPVDEVEAAYRVTREAYEKAGAGKSFRIE